jgi:hypothetical protein
MARWPVGPAVPSSQLTPATSGPKQFHRRRVRVFTCPDHATHVEGAQPMSDEDRAELDGRRVQTLRALAGLKYMRVGPVEDYNAVS